MANLKEMRRELHNNLLAEIAATGSFGVDDKRDILSCFDRAWANYVTDLVDGNSAPEPKKRTYTRKPKPATPPAEHP